MRLLLGHGLRMSKYIGVYGILVTGARPRTVALLVHTSCVL